jgi:hypothetical protein
MWDAGALPPANFLARVNQSLPILIKHRVGLILDAVQNKPATGFFFGTAPVKNAFETPPLRNRNV